MLSKEPEKLSDENFRDSLEHLADALRAAEKGDLYPIEIPPEEIKHKKGKVIGHKGKAQANIDFSNSVMKAVIFSLEPLYMSYVDEAKRRPYDPALRRLSDEITDLLSSIADQIRVPEQSVTDSGFRPGVHL